MIDYLFESLFKCEHQTFAGISLLNVSIFCFFITVNWISLGFGLLVKQNKTFENSNLGSWEITISIFHYFPPIFLFSDLC